VTSGPGAMAGSMRSLWAAGAALCALALAAAPRPAAAQSLEYPIKANYLVKFAAFVEWPPRAFQAAGAPFNVCVLGSDPFGSALDRVAAAHTVAGRPLVVRRLARVDARSGCHILYLGRAGEQSTHAALHAVAGQPVLTVTDEAWTRERGIIHFVIAANRVRFHIDDRPAGAAGLKISSRLLSLGLSVRGRG